MSLLMIIIRPPQKAVLGLRTPDLIQIEVNICMNSVLVHFLVSKPKIVELVWQFSYFYEKNEKKNSTLESCILKTILTV